MRSGKFHYIYRCEPYSEGHFFQFFFLIIYALFRIYELRTYQRNLNQTPFQQFKAAFRTHMHLRFLTLKKSLLILLFRVYCTISGMQYSHVERS